MHYKLYEKDNRYISIKDRFLVKNNIEVDAKVKCIEQGGVVNRTFVQMMEVLGHDIELTYVKRGE